MTDGPSNFRAALDAQQRAREASLRCPYCGACNRPGATYVALDDPQRAVCLVCSKSFKPEP